MIHIPKLKRLKENNQLKQYSQIYLQCSGLPVPEMYLQNANNRVYGVYHQKEMVGGFILGHGESLRTLEVFTQDNSRNELYKSLGTISDFTEITCFWINPKHRKNTKLNTFVWLSLAYCLKRFAQKKILFGTCSTSLAKLYSITPKSKLIRQDFVNNKSTYIFQSERKTCLQGFLEILRSKLSRTAKIRRQRQEKVLRKTA